MPTRRNLDLERVGAKLGPRLLVSKRAREADGCVVAAAIKANQ